MDRTRARPGGSWDRWGVNIKVRPRARPGGEQRVNIGGSEYQRRVPGLGRVEDRARRKVNIKEGASGQAGRRAESGRDGSRQTEKGREE